MAAGMRVDMWITHVPSAWNADAPEAERLAGEAENCPKVEVSERELSDLEMLSVGALSPLTGFQGEDDYRSIIETMHLTNGLPWTIPVTLSLDDEALKRVGRS